jgi:8-oxo-dGTP pyrophosphatase MutT (NUDIX family)
MALPGGRRDPQDHDLLETALRETMEEVGISISRDSLIGALPDVVPRTPVLPPIAVRPFLLTVPSRPNLTLNPEVATAAWVSLEDLLQPEAHQLVNVEVQGHSRAGWGYRLIEGVVWGMTARILTALIEPLKAVCPEES